MRTLFVLDSASMLEAPISLADSRSPCKLKRQSRRLAVLA
jgi:hypothetical protein